MNRNVWLLFSCQALMNAVMAGQVIMASLIGYKLSGGTSLNTLPMAIQQIGVMLASIPAGIVFARYGRKAGFWMGCGIAMFGSVTFAVGVYTENFIIYCFGALPAGIGFGISQHLRFAAAEVASTEARPRAISLVLAGGVLAAIVGPEMVKRTHDLIPDYVFLATYLWLPFLPIVTVVLLYFVQLPPAPPKLVSPVKFATIFARPTFITALIASLVGYGTMNLVMASTPLQMLLCGFGINESADVIRAHSVAMFLPGFITGRLIQKFGVHQIITAGALLSGACVFVNLEFAPYFSTFIVALMLLGIGWNFMFVGGTTLLTTSYEPHERVRAQATHDFIVFASVACTALSSGVLHMNAGWAALNLSLLPPLAIALVVVIWHWIARSRPAMA